MVALGINLNLYSIACGGHTAGWYTLSSPTKSELDFSDEYLAKTLTTMDEHVVCGMPPGCFLPT